MAYFKTPSAGVFFLEAEDVLRGWAKTLPAGSVAITDVEAEELLHPPLSEADRREAVQAQINALDSQIVSLRKAL